MPFSVRPVISASAFSEESNSPKLEEVVNVLKSHGIEVESKVITIESEDSNDVQSFIDNYKRPIVILHHEAPSNLHYIRRSLAQSKKVLPLTEFQISQYQVLMT